MRSVVLSMLPPLGVGSTDFLQCGTALSPRAFPVLSTRGTLTHRAKTTVLVTIAGFLLLILGPDDSRARSQFIIEYPPVEPPIPVEIS